MQSVPMQSLSQRPMLPGPKTGHSVPRMSARLIAFALLLVPAAASADELFTGALIHGAGTPFSNDIHEGGTDFQLGWRGDRLQALRVIGAPSPHAFVSVNSAGDTSFAAAGLSWKFGDRIYFRPGIGIAVQDGPSYRVLYGRRQDLGSRVLFEPEMSAGVRVTPRVSAEASWVHVSHAQIFGPQNPGLDTIGVRLVYRLR